MREGNIGETNQGQRDNHSGGKITQRKEVKCLKQNGKGEYKIKQGGNDKTRHE